MDYSGITFGVEVLLSIIFGAGGALGVWFKLKGTVNIQAVEITSLTESLKDLREEKKESNKQLCRRYDALKLVVEKNRENSDHGLNKVNSNLNSMELRIIKAIHEINK